MRMHNDSVIRKVAAAKFSMQKQRNIAVCLSIVLTTFMIYAIFSIGQSFRDSVRQQEVQSVGVDADFVLTDFTDKQEKKLRDSGLCRMAGISRQVACLSRRQAGELGIRGALFRYADDTCLERQVKPAFGRIAGNFPKKENEILIPQWLAEKLGISGGRMGQKVRLDIYYGGTAAKFNRLSEDLSVQFRVSGIYDDRSDNYVRNTAQIYVSKRFWKAAPYEDKKYRKAVYITLKEGAGRKELQEMLHLEENQELTALKSSHEEGGGGVAETVLATAAVMICGALIIYNVFSISVAQDVRFLGKMKTLGATKRQLKKYLWYQICWISLIGILIGLALAVPASALFVPFAVNALKSNTGVEQVSVSFSPVLSVGSALVCALTVLAGSLKPLHMAGQTSPISAMHYVAVHVRQKESKKSQGGMLSIAWKNIFRSRKNAAIVFLSLFMAVMILLTFDGLLSGFSASAAVGDTMYYDLVIEGDYDVISNEMMEQITDIKGVASAEPVCSRKNADSDSDGRDWLEVNDSFLKKYCEGTAKELSQIDEEAVQSAIQGDYYASYLIGIGQVEFERLRKECGLELNYDEFESGEAGIWLCDTKSDRMPAGEQTIRLGGTDGKKVTIPKMESRPVDMSTFLTISEVAPNILISNEALNNVADTDICITKINIRLEDPALDAQIQRAIKEILGDTQEISIDSRQEKVEQKARSFFSLQMLGITMSVVLFFIAVLNFMNTIYAGILARDRELAMLECIGMSKKQIKQMLVIEGCLYVFITTFLVLTLGTAIYLLAYQMFTKLADWAQFEYPFGMAGITEIIMLLLSVMVPLVSYRSISKGSAIEQLRKAEM